MVEEEVFKKAFIPRSLMEVEDYERDSERVASGDATGIYYQTLAGMTKSVMGGGAEAPSHMDSSSEEESSSSDAGSDKGEGEEQEGGADMDVDGVAAGRGGKKTLDFPEELLGLDAKERKKAVKQMKREKRAEKIPKHVKKRAKKEAAARRGKK